MEVIERFDGRAFPTMAGLARQWATAACARGRRRSRRSTAPSSSRPPTSTWACCPSERPASWYDPGKFWSGDRIELVPPFALGGEVAITG